MVDDLFSHPMEEAPMAQGVSATFVISGRVVDQNGVPVPNIFLKGNVHYAQWVNGVDTPQGPPITFVADGNGNYSYIFPGPDGPLLNYDQNYGLVVFILSDDLRWKTTDGGEYEGAPAITNPTPIFVADTKVKKM